MVQQTLESPTELLHLQLRAALTMEDDSLVAVGRHAAFVHLRDATWEIDDVAAPFTKESVKSAPQYDSDGLSPAQEKDFERAYAASASDERAGSQPGEDESRTS